MPQLLKKSGTTDTNVFVRPFVDVREKTVSEYTNLWLHATSLDEAKKKCAALPRDKTYGLAWSQKDFAVRVRNIDAAEIAPIATGRQFVMGDKYEIHGVPRDWQPGDFFEALNMTDTPWPRIREAQVINQRPMHGAYRWLIKAPEPPPTSIIFLDEYVLSIKKYEARTPEPKQHKLPPKPTLSAWMKTPICPGDENMRTNDENDTRSTAASGGDEAGAEGGDAAGQHGLRGAPLGKV